MPIKQNMPPIPVPILAPSSPKKIPEPPIQQQEESAKMLSSITPSPEEPSLLTTNTPSIKQSQTEFDDFQSTHRSSRKTLLERT